MTPAEPSANRRRSRGFLLEGLTIVLSILLAFGIDAWWDTTRSRTEQDRLLDTVRIELATNRQRLESILDRGDVAEEAGRTLVELIGPATEPMGSETLGPLMGRLFDAGGARLQLVATDAYLTEADFDSGRAATLFSLLASVRGTNEKYARETELYEQHRDRVLTYLNGIPGTNGGSDFPMDPLQIQRDHELESLVANMYIRTRVMNTDAERLVALVDSAARLLAGR